ncbi:MAG TPA: phosphocholine cytidylyltransferase family protein [Burkholderiales bacterium]|nr:phosphocholine cytidylyltransferase family protein [Burkholderiales bacterium]
MSGDIPIRAIILAAGRGSRLGRHSAERPKALAMLAGRSLLQWKLDALAALGIRDVTVLTGYRCEAIEATGVDTVHNPRWADTNMVASLCCAHALLRQPGRTLVCYGDVLFHPDAVALASQAEADIVLPYDRCWRQLWALRFTDPLVDAESFKQINGTLLDIGRKPLQLDEVQGQFMGLALITQNGWRTIHDALERYGQSAVDRLDTTGLLQRLLHSDVAIRAVPIDGKWCEIDSAEDLALYARLVQQGEWSHDWRWEDRT